MDALKLISAKDLRDRLGEHLDRAHLSGEAFVVTRRDRPKAVLVSPDHYLELLERLAAYENGQRPPVRTPARRSQLVTLDQLKQLIR